MEHTPGPWTYIEGDYVRKESNDGTICLVCEDDGHVDSKCAEQLPKDANAHLIAAAPDLLEACHSSCCLCEMMHGKEIKERCEPCKIGKAIRKAEGVI